MDGDLGQGCRVWRKARAQGGDVGHPGRREIGGELECEICLATAVIRASDAATVSTDRVAADIAVIVAVLLPTRPDRTVPEIEKRLLINRFDGSYERPGIMDAVTRLMIVSGLVSQGELEALADQTPAAPTVTTEA